MKVRVLTEADCRRLLNMAEAIPLQGDAFRSLAAGEAVDGLRSHAVSESPPGVAIFNPCFLKKGRGYGVKVVSDFYENSGDDVPRMTASMTLMDGTTGAPHTFMEAGYLTDLRTGAGTGFAATVLARPDADELAVIGAGRVARFQILALVEALPIRKVRISTRTEARGRELIADLGDLGGVSVELVGSPREAVRGAGIVIAATTARAPVLDGADVEPGSLVVSVGSYEATFRELDSEVVRRAALCVIDSVADCLPDAGEYQMAAAEGVLRLESVVGIGDIALDASRGRRHDDDIVVYKSIGVPIQDLFTGEAIARKAREHGVGLVVEMNP